MIRVLTALRHLSIREENIISNVDFWELQFLGPFPKLRKYG